VLYTLRKKKNPFSGNISRGQLDRFWHGQEGKNRALTVSVMVKVWKDKFWNGYSRGPGSSISGKCLLRKNAFKE